MLVPRNIEGEWCLDADIGLYYGGRYIQQKQG